MDYSKVWEYLTAIILAAAGGLARLLSNKDKQSIKWAVIISEVFIAGFTGLMMLFALRIAGAEGAYIGLLCGLSGWLGPKVLGALAKIGKPLGIDLTEKTEDKKGDKQNE